MPEDIKPECSDEVLRALSALAQAALSSELASLRGSVADLDARLSAHTDRAQQERDQFLEQLKGEASSRIESLAREVTTGLEEATRATSDTSRDALGQIEELRRGLATAAEAHERALADVYNRTAHWIGDLERRLQEVRSHVGERVESATGVLERRLSTETVQLRHELGELTKTVAATHGELQHHKADSERVSALFDSISSAFSKTAGAPRDVGRRPERPLGGGEKELDNALDQVFVTDPSRPSPPEP